MREVTDAAGAGMVAALWRFRRYGRPHVPRLLAGLGLRVGELGADLAQPWPLAVVVDSVLGHKALSGPLGPLLRPFGGRPVVLLTAAAGAAITFAVVSAALDYLGDRIMNGAGERITSAIRSDVFGRLQRLPLSFHDAHSVGELTSRVSVDTDNIEDALVDIFSTLVPGALAISGLVIAMLVLNSKLGLIALVSAPLLLLTVGRYTRMTRRAARVRRVEEGMLAGLVAETLTGVKAVHALDAHELHDRRFASVNAATLRAGLRAVELKARFAPIVESCAAVGAAALLWLGAWGVMRGWWTLGVVLVALTYTKNMLKPMRSLSRLSLTLPRGAASAERVLAVIDEPMVAHPPVTHSTIRRRTLPARARGGVRLDHVSLDYGRGLALHDVTLSVEAGERVALLGSNGAGKSSLLAVLAGLYEPSEGTALLDDVPIDQLPLRWLRRQLAVVLQDTVLFSGTLRDNILYGREVVSRGQIRAVTDAALVTEFASQLPKGLDTQLGDRGIGLSGGQRQRVAIARALLRDAPVVLLDEPTSGLDPEAEALVVEALRPLVAGRTVLMATHRPALLALATRVVRVEDGRVSSHNRLRSRSSEER